MIGPIQKRWEKGQRVVLDRREIVTIDAVTPSGRAKIGNRSFHAADHRWGGIEIGGRGSRWNSSSIEELTSENQAEADLRDRATKASRALYTEVTKAERFMRTVSGGSRYQNLSSVEEIEKAERLIAAIRDVLDVKEKADA